MNGRSMIRYKHKDKIAEVEIETHRYPLMNDKYFSVNITNVKPNNSNIFAGYDRFKTKSQALKFAKEYMRTH